MPHQLTADSTRRFVAVWKLGREGAVPASLHGLQFFANHDDTQLLVEAYVRPGSNAQELQPFTAALHSVLPAVAGVMVFPVFSIENECRQRTRPTSTPAEASQAIGGDSLTYHAAGQQYRVSGGSFFQTNRYLIDTLARWRPPVEAGALRSISTRESACLRCRWRVSSIRCWQWNRRQIPRRSAPQRSQQREVHSCDDRAVSR